MISNIATISKREDFSGQPLQYYTSPKVKMFPVKF